MPFIEETRTGELEAASRMQSTMESQVAAAAELKHSHESNLAAVQTHSDHYLKEEYSEDEPTCSTPRRRPIQVPTQSSINALCTPPLDILLNEFRAKSAAGGPDRLSKVFPSIEASFRDFRTPLLAIN